MNFYVESHQKVAIPLCFSWKLHELNPKSSLVFTVVDFDKFSRLNLLKIVTPNVTWN